MKRSNILFRGAKGFSWYGHFKKQGADGFRKNTVPTPFDWQNSALPRPKAYFDVSIGSDKLGRLVFELANDVLPKTVENFKHLCCGTGESGKSYKGSKFHVVSKDKFIMGGDVETLDGTSSHSASKDRFIADENFIIPHSGKGLISMASVGVDTMGSQFYITLSENPQLNGRCTAFGRIIEGDKMFEAIQKVFTIRYAPTTEIVITDCGML